MLVAHDVHVRQKATPGFNPEEAPCRNELALDNFEVFDLTGLKKAEDNAHDRAFEDVTSVVGMAKASK